MDIPIIANFQFVFSGDAKELKTNYERLLANVAKNNVFLGKIVMMLHNRNALTTDELSVLIDHFTEIASPNLELAMKTAESKGNPLLPNESNRLKMYIDKAKNHLPFSSDEIHDYQTLVEKAKQEQSKGSDPWPLIALGAFLLGLWLGTQKK